MPNGFGNGGGGFSFGDLLTGLLSQLFAVIAAIISFLNALVGVLVNALNFLYNGELGIFGFSFAGIGDVWKIFMHLGARIWNTVFKAALFHILDLVHRIQAWAKKLKAWLDKFHALQRRYQILAFRRVINLIQRARKILLIFRVFHLKFATKLDNFLTGIEGRLIRRELDIARKTNEIIAWVNLIADPSTLFRQVPYLQSLGRSLRDLLAGVSALGIEHRLPAFLQVRGPGVPARPWPQFAAEFHQETRDNSGNWGALHESALGYRQMFDQGFSTPR